jgi:hypothetical protein
MATATGGIIMTPKHRIFTMALSKVYPLYVQKAERKHRTKDEVDQLICWLTGYNQAGYSSKSNRKMILKPSLLRHPPCIPIARSSKGLCAVFAWKKSMTL